MWFPALNVEEDARIVASPSPGFGSAPVNCCLVEFNYFLWFLLNGQVSFFDEPLVETESSSHAFRAMV